MSSKKLHGRGASVLANQFLTLLTKSVIQAVDVSTCEVEVIADLEPIRKHFYHPHSLTDPRSIAVTSDMRWSVM